MKSYYLSSIRYVLGRYVLGIILLAVAPGLYSQSSLGSEPEWVSVYKFKGSLAGFVPPNCYHGFGVSKQSQMDADNQARVDFQGQIGTAIHAEYQRNVAESDSVYADFSQQIVKTIISDVMRGITITERWEDTSRVLYYALIQIDKSEFDTLYLTEKRRAEERQTQELAMESEAAQSRAVTVLRDNQVQDSLTHERQIQILRADSLSRARDEVQFASDQAARATKIIRLDALALEKRTFLSRGPSNELVTLRNSRIHRGKLELNGKMAINPIAMPGGSVTYTLEALPLEFTGSLYSEDGTVNAQEGVIRLQVLPPTGKLYQISLVFGVIEFANDLAHTQGRMMQPQWSALGAGNISLANIDSWVSVYADVRMIRVGLEHFLFYNHLDGKVSAIAQTDFIFDERWRTKYDGSFLFQTGFRFVPSENLRASFTYEGDNSFVFTLTIRI